MSNVTVLKDRDRGRQKKILQACEMGGSIYGRAARPGIIERKATPGTGGGLAADYKNFYRSQFDLMNKVFKKNTQ
jgi:hypothetical protein